MRRHSDRIVAAIVAVAVWGSMLLPFAPADAASFLNMKDTMTRLKASATANHVLQATLPSGVNFGWNTSFSDRDILAYDFPESSAFSGSASGTWITSDFAFNDGTSRTIAKVDQGSGVSTVNCTNGANNVGVAVDTSALTFRVIPCGASFTPSATAATAMFTVLGTTPDGTLTNPSSPGTYSISLSMQDGGVAAAETGTLDVSIVDEDQVSVTATVSPSLTFDLDTSATNTDTAAPYTVPLGTLSTGAVTSSNLDNETGADINAVWVDLASNASAGTVVTVSSSNTSLASASVPADAIPTGTATLVAGTEGYGVCVSSGNGAPTQTSGSTLTAVSPYNGSCTDTAHAVGALQTTPQNILSATGPLAGGRAAIRVKASISATTKAHTDYQDTLTFIATGTF